MFAFALNSAGTGAQPMTSRDTRHDSIPVVDLRNGECGRVVSIEGGRSMLQRLMSLGITKGSEIEILHHRGKGVVVGLNGNRIALGAGVANQVCVTPLESCDH